MTTFFEQPAETKRLLLSFAIPTYNFGGFISETVQSIIDGAAELGPDDFEIVILDGGSRDDTDKVVAELGTRYRNLHYQKNAARGGIDRDMNEVAGLAAGEYIWLFSADDLLVPGWDKVVAPLLRTGKDLYLVPAELCDFNMGHLRNNPIFKDCEDDLPVEFNFGSIGVIDAYLKRANTLAALFSFMSAVVVKRSVWHGLKERPDYYGSCWAHCARLIPLLFQNTSIIYANRFLIRKRGGNDTFMENGFVARIGVAVDGWGRIIQEFFSDPAQRFALFQALRKDMPILLFLYAKISARNKSEIKRLDGMARSLYLDWSPPPEAGRQYLLYRLMPASPILSRWLKPFLPILIRIRHKIRAIFSSR